MGGFFENLWGGAVDGATNTATNNVVGNSTDTSGGFSFSNLLGDSNVLSTLLTGGLGLYSGIQKAKSEEEALKMQQALEKFKFLQSLNKGGGGGGGGGGGSALARNKLMIETLGSVKESSNDAWNNLSKNYSAALSLRGK